MRRRQALEHTPFPKVYPKKWATWCNQVSSNRGLSYSQREYIETKTTASLREGSQTFNNDSVLVSVDEASSDTVESEGWQMKDKVDKRTPKNPPVKMFRFVRESL
jgi:hypothetical protein